MRKFVVYMEIWLPVKGFDGYFVSSKGVVVAKRKSRNGIELKQHKNKKGYLVCTMYTAEGLMKTTPVHRIVANNFIPNPLGKAQVNHINGIKTDNTVDNLEWATHQENMTHAKEAGLIRGALGESHHQAKLTISDIDSIRQKYATGLRSKRSLAREYKISQMHAIRIIGNKSWKHLANN